MTFVCEWCGKEFNGAPSRAKNKHICCSRECASNLKKNQAELNCVCPICGKKFHCKPFHVRKYKTICCSNECCKLYRHDLMSGEGNHQYGLKGDKNASWKSDEKISNYGYRLISCLDHPFRTHDDFVFEHRLVAEQYLLTEENSVEVDGKRYLKPEYAFHHIDGDRLNNDPSNLLVLTKGEHTALHNKLKQRKRDAKTSRFVSGA